MNTYRATLGRRRSFLSQADADAYDDGVRDHAAGHPAPTGYTPKLQGWVDAEHAAIDAIDYAEGFAQ